MWITLALLLVGPADAALQRSASTPESRDVYTGPVEVSIADNFEGGASTTLYRFQRGGLPVVAHQLASDAPNVRCGDTVRLEGVRLGGTMEVGRAEIAKRGMADEACQTVGDQRVAVILATFPGTPAPAVTGSQLRRLLFDPAGQSANSWFRQFSFGKVSLSGDVFGPYVLDRSYSCGETAQMQAAAIRASDNDIDFRSFRRFILIFPPVPGCAFGAMATMGCGEIQSSDGPMRASWIWANYTANTSQLLYYMIHELGHNLGLGHSRRLHFPAEALEADDYRALPVEYGDTSSVMGNAPYGDLPAAHKLRLGWVDPSSVVPVEGDTEILVAPSEKETGVKALRVLRRVGTGEWLWVEFNTRFYGALVRRETPDSPQLTNLLDMTPATLDQARVDLGVASANEPALPPGTTWNDPHSDLSINVGYPQSEGIPVSIRYGGRCATQTTQELTVSADQQEIRLPVEASAECDWQASSGRTWLDASRIGPEALIKVSAIAGNLHRSGVVSIGRQTVKVIQQGPTRDLTVMSVSPPGAQMPIGSFVPFLFHLRDENGTDDMQALQLSVIPQSGSTAKPCYFRYSALRKVVEAGIDEASFQDGESADTANSGSCALQAMIYRVNQTEIIFRFSLRFSGTEGEALAVSVRAEDAAGVAGPWTRAADLTTTQQCRALPSIDYLSYTSAAAAAQAIPVVASAPACGWSATTDAGWIRLIESSADASGTLRFEIAANPDPGSREGRIFVNGAPVRVIQFGNGEILSYFVTLRPPETVVSRLPGAGALTFFYGLGDLVPAYSDSPWLRVTRVDRSADRREVHFQFEANTESSPRLGTIVVGGKTFTVLQREWPVFW